MTVTDSAVDTTILTLTNANDDAWYHALESKSTAVWDVGANVTYPVLNGTPSLVVSSGGDTKTGQMILYWL